jgi:Fe-S oxidoreductase
MANTRYIDAFIPAGKDDKGCINCGICLQKCPVMKMDKAQSRSEFEKLLKGEEPERVLNECTFCFSCNAFCPQELKPYALIMERMMEKNKKNGKDIPASFRYMFTGEGATNYFDDAYKAGSAEDKAILDRWTTVPPKAKETLFIGCTGRSVPRSIETSDVLAGLPKYAPRDACCGELSYRFGDYDVFARTVERTRKLLESLDTERLICYCGSCDNFFGNIWPNLHGVKLPFEIISLWEWLWQKYQAGELTVKRPLSGKIVITDACYSSELGDDFYEAIRGLHKAVGLEVVELKNNRRDALSCGFASRIRNNDESQVKLEAAKKIKQIKDAQVIDVSCYCPGCFSVISGAGKKEGVKGYYSMDKILYAFGDDVPAFYV